VSTATPTVRAQEEKAKKQKRLLAVLSVVLLALMGYQLPKLLGGSGSSSTSAAPSPSVAAESLPGAVSTLPPGQLPNTDHVSVNPGSTKLISFGLFKSKDPFAPQLSTEPGPVATPSLTPQTVVPPAAAVAPAAATSSPSVPKVSPVQSAAPTGSVTPVVPPITPVSKAPTTSTTPIVPAPVTPITPNPVSTTPVRTTTTPKPATAAPAAQAAPTSVAISTNGTCENVGVNGTFPGKEDIFRVVSIGKDGKTAKIGVVGGAYDSGDATATIKVGEKVTLVNTADGTRYVILMQAHCAAGTAPAAPAAPTNGVTAPASTIPTSTVAPPTPTSTVTTPIVTDSLDTTTPAP
jgi:hypothetical protein